PTVSPRRAALARSMIKLASGPPCCWSKLTSQQRQMFECVCDLGRPLVELSRVFAKQCVLVSGVAGLRGDPDILIRSQIERPAGNVVGFGPRPVCNPLGRGPAFGQRL